MHRHPERASLRRIAQGLPDATLHQHRWHQAARERTHLVHRVVHLVAQLAQALAHPLGMRLCEVARELQLDRQRHESLLRAVVQVAFDAPSLEVRRRHDPAARFTQLSKRRAKLRLEALVLEGHECEARGHIGDHGRVHDERRVVYEDRHPSPGFPGPP